MKTSKKVHDYIHKTCNPKKDKSQAKLAFFFNFFLIFSNLGQMAGIFALFFMNFMSYVENCS